MHLVWKSQLGDYPSSIRDLMTPFYRQIDYTSVVVPVTNCNSPQLSRFVPEAIVGRETFKGWIFLLARDENEQKRGLQGVGGRVRAATRLLNINGSY